MFMYGRVIKALGVKGLGHEILMKFYQFCRQYFMLIPCFFFHRFCLVAAVIVVASQLVASPTCGSQTNWGLQLWALYCGLGVNQGLFEGPSNQNEWG